MTAVPPPAPDEQTAIRRVIQKMQLPMVSGATSAIVLFVCLLAACSLVFVVGMTMHLAPWIRVELMMVAWWLIWTISLATVLYRGLRVSDDHVLGAPRSWWGGRGKDQKAGRGSSWLSGSWDLPLGGADEGCAWVVGIVLAIAAALVLAWLLIEVVVPVLAFIFYAMIRGMLARIANNDHGCAGHPGLAVFWAAVWATVYSAPLALLVFVIHLIVAQRAGA